MKRLVILIVLVVLAAIAGVVVRSSSSKDGTVAEIRELVSHQAADEVREEIRQSYELAPGARVELSGINGSVKIETSDTKTAEVYIERTASSQEALNRRKIEIQADANRLSIRGETTDHNFFAKLFGSKASERVTLKVPRQISLYGKGVNGGFFAEEIDGALELGGINGKVQVANASGSATLKGINGNVVFGMKRIEAEGVTLSGINGNIELQLPADVNADFDAKGMNGRVIADFPNVVVEKGKRSTYWARLGSGGSGITAKGINGNIRLTRTASSTPATPAAAGVTKL
jgi:Putative adhesin